MAVKVGPARKKKPRTRPRGVDKRAVWDDRSLVWRDGDFWFDEKAAAAAVGFFPEHLCLTAGEWAGRPFDLEDWQQDDIVRPLFGWKRPDGTRRYRRCYVWVPRKNGKTELAAGIALLVLVGDAEEAGQVYSIAKDKDQASLVFDKATLMVGKSETLPADLECFKTSIYCPALNASFKPLSGRPTGKHGLSMSGLVGDEIHEWDNGDLYQFIHDSVDARRQPLEFLISTAGKKGGYGEQIWDECLKIRDGLIDDPETLVVIYAADEDDDWTSPEVWRKANPNLGISKKVDALAMNAKRAMQLPRLVNDFKRYQLNMWTDQATIWLPIDGLDDDGNPFGWDHCIGPTAWNDLEAHLAGKRCFGGLDLSAVQDLSALSWYFPVQAGLDVPVVLPRFFKPKSLLKQHSTRDRLPYERWVDEGAIIATPGNVIDYAFIKKQIFDDGERFQIAHAGSSELEDGQGGLAIDRWNATQLAVELQQENLPVVLYGQGYFSMNPPSKELERLVLCNGFHHGGHPVLRRHAQVVSVESNPVGDIKPVKGKQTERIDGIVATVMAMGIAARDKGEDPSMDEYFRSLAAAE
ncbi:terminase TerL endonuclease subunit [Aminobacter sp. P9b]|uniref:terminase large subunit n=1 Tax=Aminobacter sp. P9b TaxID=3133697 RepID=UPI00324F3D03